MNPEHLKVGDRFTHPTSGFVEVTSPPRTDGTHVLVGTALLRRNGEPAGLWQTSRLPMGVALVEAR